MSAHESHAHDAPQASLTGFGSAAGLVGALIAGGMAIAMVAMPGMAEQIAQSYLYAYIVGFTAVLGCLGITLLHHCVRGSWGLSMLRITEAGSSPLAFGVFGILFLPIAFATKQGHLYHHWTHPEHPFHGFKAWIHSEPRFYATAAILFIFWIAISAKLRSSSIRQDTNQDDAERAMRTNFASPMLVAYMLSVTIMCTDWVMSLNPHWFSSIFGVLFAISAALTALAFGTIIILSNRDKAPYSEIITPQLTKDLGNMLFTFSMLWAYMTLSQWLIMWCGNLPEFIQYYTDRNGTGALSKMGIIGALNVFFGFFVAWTALLFPRVKREPKMLLAVAWIILIVRATDMFYHVMGFMRPGDAFNMWDIAGAAGMLLLFAGLATWGTKSASLYPEHDQRLKEAALNHHG